MYAVELERLHEPVESAGRVYLHAVHPVRTALCGPIHQVRMGESSRAGGIRTAQAYLIHPPEIIVVNDKELAALIARDIFQALSEPWDKCQRIQGKGGEYPERETSLGGLGEEPLANVIESSLAEHRSY